MEKKEDQLLFHRLSDRIFESVQENMQLERRQALLIKLGIDTVLNVIPKLILTIILASLLHELVPVLVFMVSFMALRGFAYGRHLKSDLLCTIITILVFVGLPYMLSYVSGINQFERVVVSLLFTGLIAFFAPADTKKNPITSLSLRRKLKCQAIVISIILIVIQLFVHDYIGTIILSSMFMVVLLLLPLGGKNKNEKF